MTAVRGAAVFAAMLAASLWLGAACAQESPAGTPQEPDDPVSEQPLSDEEFDALFGPGGTLDTPAGDEVTTEGPELGLPDPGVEAPPGQTGPLVDPGPRSAGTLVTDQPEPQYTPEECDALNAAIEGLPEGAEMPVTEDGEPFELPLECVVEGPPVMTPQDAYQQKSAALLRGLDKITGRYTDLDVTVDEPVVFGTVEITVKACYDTPPDLPPEAGAFLKIRSMKPIAPESMTEEMAARLKGKDKESEDVQKPELFSGWMFASSPGLNGLEHPVYDVWVMKCSAS